MGLERWRLSRIEDRDNTPIFLAIKNNQRVFNGYGAQETCDMLFEALLSPFMPAFAICEDPQLWNRFETALFDYQETRLDLINSIPSILPFVSGRRPFRFDRNGHNLFLMHVSTYRRQYIKANSDQLAKLNKYNLLNPNAILQNDGRAVGKYCNLILGSTNVPSLVTTGDETETFNTLSIRPGCEHCILQNYQIDMPAGKNSQKTVKVYSPFRAKINPFWWPIKVL